MCSVGRVKVKGGEGAQAVMASQGELPSLGHTSHSQPNDDEQESGYNCKISGL